MHLFNASSLFSQSATDEVKELLNDENKLRAKLIEVKKALLHNYNFTAHCVPEDFTSTPYVIATNHLTDSDAPLIMSFYYDIMKDYIPTYPQLFVFAKENCFNGVSIPRELLPILEIEKVLEVDRKSVGGSMAAMKAAGKWFKEGDIVKHFLIFAQGTIYDINKDCAEDIEQGAFWLARLLGIQVLPAFIEQAAEGESNRIIFAEPISVPKDCRDFAQIKEQWLRAVIGAQDSLGEVTGTPARVAELDAEHQVRKRNKVK